MYCPSCGTNVAADQNFCKRCGAALSGEAGLETRPVAWPPPLPATRAIPVPNSPAERTPPNTSSLTPLPIRVYAALWRRIVAYGIDYVVVVVLIALLAAVLAEVASNKQYVSIEVFVAVWLYKALLESSQWQGTLGKIALGIKVSSTTGERISFGRASGRFFAQILSYFILFIGYIMAGFTQRRQALHDLIAGTVVVGRRFKQAEIANAPPATGSEGIVLLVLLIPAIGILAAIAIPAYQDYTIRAQIADGINVADPLKVATVAFYARTGTWPSGVTGGSETLNYPTIPSGKYVLAADIGTPGSITITYGNQANTTIAGKTLTFNAYLSASGDVVWACGMSTTGLESLTAVGHSPTSIPSRYLPSACKQ